MSEWFWLWFYIIFAVLNFAIQDWKLVADIFQKSWEGGLATKDIGKKGNRFSWALGFFFCGVGGVIALLTNARSMPLWAINVLTFASGLCFFIAAWLFNLFKAPYVIGRFFRAGFIAVGITGALLVFRHYIWPTPNIEISKDFTSLSIVIPSGGNANIGTARDDFKIDFVLYSNSESVNVTRPKPCPELHRLPGMMFVYHVFNNNSYSISDLHATFTSDFLGGPKGATVLASRAFDVYVKSISANSAYSFYFVNESKNPVQINTPDSVVVDVPSEGEMTVPITKGKVTMGTFPISDIAKEIPGGALIDLPLSPTTYPWEETSCGDRSPQISAEANKPQPKSVPGLTVHDEDQSVATSFYGALNDLRFYERSQIDYKCQQEDRECNEVLDERFAIKWRKEFYPILSRLLTQMKERGMQSSRFDKWMDPNATPKAKDSFSIFADGLAADRDFESQAGLEGYSVFVHKGQGNKIKGMDRVIIDKSTNNTVEK